jgi:hypothetical protein
MCCVDRLNPQPKADFLERCAFSLGEPVEYIAKLLLILFMAMVAACSQPKEFKMLQVKIKPDVFIINGQTYSTSAELKSALKTMPRPDAIGLVQEGGISTERHNEAISAIQGANLNVPIAFVGNEVFY